METSEPSVPSNKTVLIYSEFFYSVFTTSKDWSEMGVNSSEEGTYSLYLFFETSKVRKNSKAKIIQPPWTQRTTV